MTTMPTHASVYPALCSNEQTRALEQNLAASLPPYTLMQRAGTASARLALALAPHARHIWIACGPGNNGGDGLEAAIHLAAAGKQVHISLLPADRNGTPADASQALRRAQAAGLHIHKQAPEHFDLAIDALWGIGLRADLDLPAGSAAADWVQHLLHTEKPVLCIDTPSGLLADTGALAPAAAALAPPAPCGPRFTLSMLCLHPGLFTHQGSDWAGQVWLAPLAHGSDAQAVNQHLATTLGDSMASGQLVTHCPAQNQAQNSHKGQFGDVGVVGGAAGMEGAAILAATAALHSGAGRVMLNLLDSAERPAALAPDIMQRPLSAMAGLRGALVAGCGGGNSIAAVPPLLLAHAGPLVLDADALNALAQDEALCNSLRARSAKAATVLTPHPLELARLLNHSTAQIQADRIGAAKQAAEQWQCIVVLKGSGSIIAAPDGRYAINHSGNARLSIGGTGDVLAGCIGAQLAPLPANADWQPAWQATLNAVWLHGRVADLWHRFRPDQPTLTASALAETLPRQPWTI